MLAAIILMVLFINFGHNHVYLKLLRINTDLYLYMLS